MADEVIHRIDAKGKTVREVLDTKKYGLDYYQREFLWGKEQIEQFLEDLVSKFIESYDSDHERSKVEDYAGYFLGPIIINAKEGKFSLVDGQQRITSMTLLLIFLHHLQNDREDAVSINDLICSERYGDKSFNLVTPERADCMTGLFESGKYQITNSPSEVDESVRNIVERYADIELLFPDELKEDALPFFIDWLTEKVTFVVISTFSDDDAYKIFETMNDRGLELSPSDMLKGYMLSKSPKPERDNLNQFWKRQKQKLEEIVDYSKVNKEFDDFFRAFFRARYAVTIRQGKTGAGNEDFERIGTRFHLWFRDNEEKQFKLKTQTDFSSFVKSDLPFYLDVYINITKHRIDYNERFESIYIFEELGLAPSVFYPLLLASISKNDDSETIAKKLSLTSKFLEFFIIFRSVNYKSYSQTGIRYTMYSLTREIRNKSVKELADIYKQRISEMEYNLDTFSELKLHGQNRLFIHMVLTKITTFVERESGMENRFNEYWNGEYDIEHIAPEAYYATHQGDFKDEAEFKEWRNHIGGLLILLSSFNRSYNNSPYETKVKHYFGNNLLAKSFNPNCYTNNPGFLRFLDEYKFSFKSYDHFDKKSLVDRQQLYEDVMREIYSLKRFDEIVKN